MIPPSNLALSRRAFLGSSAGTLGSLALAHLAVEAADPLAPKPPHYAPKAKAVICLFQHGGPSQMDLFDPKPELTKQHGKDHPDKLETHFHTQTGKLLASPFKFEKRGKAGIELSELLPQTAGIIDDITLVRSMMTESVDHEAALRLVHSGKAFPRPAGVGLVGALRARLGTQGTARLCCPLRSRRAAGGWHEQLVVRVSASGVSRNAVPCDGHAGRAPCEPGRRFTCRSTESTRFAERFERIAPSQASGKCGT